MKKFSLFPHFVSKHYPEATCFLYLINPEVLQALQLVLPDPVQPLQEISQLVHVVENNIWVAIHAEHSDTKGPVQWVQAASHFLQVVNPSW